MRIQRGIFSDARRHGHWCLRRDRWRGSRNEWLSQTSFLATKTHLWRTVDAAPCFWEKRNSLDTNQLEVFSFRIRNSWDFTRDLRSKNASDSRDDGPHFVHTVSPANPVSKLNIANRGPAPMRFDFFSIRVLRTIEQRLFPQRDSGSWYAAARPRLRGR